MGGVPLRDGRRRERGLTLQAHFRNFSGALQAQIPILKAREFTPVWLDAPEDLVLLAFELIVLGVATFAGLIGLVELCDRV